MVYNLSEAADRFEIDEDDEQRKIREVLRMAASGKIFLSTYYEGLYFSGDFSAGDRNVLSYKGYAFIPTEDVNFILSFDRAETKSLIFNDRLAHKLAYKATIKGEKRSNKWGDDYDQYRSYDREEIRENSLSALLHFIVVEEREIERWRENQLPEEKNKKKPGPDPDKTALVIIGSMLQLLKERDNFKTQKDIMEAIKKLKLKDSCSNTKMEEYFAKANKIIGVKDNDIAAP